MNGWFARTLLLVLSGLATLTLIGAIAAVPIVSIDQQQPPPAEVEIATTADPAPPAEDVTWVARPSAAAAADPAERWLESIAYALIALAIFGAAMLVVLLRIAGQLEAIARSRAQ